MLSVVDLMLSSEEVLVGAFKIVFSCKQGKQPLHNMCSNTTISFICLIWSGGKLSALPICEYRAAGIIVNCCLVAIRNLLKH
jgi:hypothetical protein